MILLNPAPSAKGVGKGYLPHPSPVRGYSKGTLEGILKYVFGGRTQRDLISAFENLKQIMDSGLSPVGRVERGGRCPV